MSLQTVFCDGAQGKLKCLGTQQRLKTRFGDGVKIVFNLDHAYNVSRSLFPCF